DLRCFYAATQCGMPSMAAGYLAAEPENISALILIMTINLFAINGLRSVDGFAHNVIHINCA
ncbi:MAG: hypothetical protein ABI476_09315, partial [Oxalobacteraceae bacterium]